LRVRFTSKVLVLDAPTNLGLKPPAPRHAPGVRRLPEALRAHRLLERLGAEDAGRLEPPAYRFAIDRATGVRNTDSIARFPHDVAEAVGPLLDRGDFPLVLGGDCSLLLGPALALRRRGAFGLCFVDGHQDLLTPKTSQTGGAAGMDLALACGVGPTALAQLAGPSPLVEASGVLLLGDRSGNSGYPGAAIDRARRRMFLAPLTSLRRRGVGAIVADGLAHLRRAGLDRLWLHFDVDALDDEIMPAVDSRQPGGLSWEEVVSLLRTLLASGIACGMDVTILDPERDPDGLCAEALMGILEESFAAARSAD
jgi:arginase